MEEYSLIQVFTSGSASLLSISTAFPVILMFNSSFHYIDSCRVDRHSKIKIRLTCSMLFYWEILFSHLLINFVSFDPKFSDRSPCLFPHSYCHRWLLNRFWRYLLPNVYALFAYGLFEKF